ncbi:unnamed protein product, partial [Medioppia subpectinata]
NKSSNSLSVSSNLSRSISSPNIAQLLEKEMNGKHMDNIDTNEGKERSMTTPSQPQFDRTLKPAINREKLYFNDSTVIEDKVRDFCPVRSGGTSITGLKNLGNTCYSNAVVQCLLNTTEFSSFFSRNLKINKNSKYGSNGELVMELAALFRHMAYPSFYTMLSAKDFRQAVSKHIKDFVPGAQQDSHEFLVKLFEKLHDDLNESTKWDVINTGVSEGLSLDARAMKFWKQHISKNNSIISQLFEGLIVNTLSCLKCGEKSDSFEVFSCLSLPIGNSRTTLTECLNQYFKPERMSGETAWECPTCKQKREADKRLQLWKLPKILIVHLKRFSIEGRYKLRTYVDFPINDLPMRTIQSANPIQYSLYGVVNHFGTLEGGHYTALSKHIKDFVPGAQQDSHEFLVKLFEKLHDDLNESTKWDVINTGISEGLSLDARAMKFWKQHMSKNNSIISQLFEGLIVNTLSCLKCGEKSDSFEVFSCLSLPIGNSRTTLTECLNQYFKPERMSGETAWECPTCKQKREADKRLQLWKLPKILIVHLKRFSIEGRYKLRTYVDFPINDLPMRTIQSANPIQYSLYGVVNHFGTLEGGHYTAFSHNQNKYKWHKFDDQDVTQTNPAEVKSESAYILFYRCC